MNINDRISELKSITEKLNDEQRTTITPLIVDIAFMESKLADLRKLEHIRVHPKNPSRQMQTAAGKMYKETLQGYIQAVKVVMTALQRTDTSAADELLAKLDEYTL